MQIRELADVLALLAGRDQHRHNFATIINTAIESIFGAHDWSFARSMFYFESDTQVVSTDSWSILSGTNRLTVVAAPGDAVRDWTGAEIKIVASSGTLYARIVHVGTKGTTNLDSIYIDRPAPKDFLAATITVFRRDYVPRGGVDRRLFASKIRSKIKIRGDQYNGDGLYWIPNFKVRQDEYMYANAFTTRVCRKIDPPVYTVTSATTDNNGAFAGVSGTYYLATSWYDIKSGEMSDLGPITKIEFNAAAANRITNVLYNAPGSFPERSYRLVLWCSRPDPLGLDGVELTKSEYINSRYIPMYRVGEYDRATSRFNSDDGGAPAAIPMDGRIPTYERYYHSDNTEIVTILSNPTSKLAFEAEGKIRLPWYNDPADSVILPDSMTSIISLAVQLLVTQGTGADSSQLRAQLAFELGRLKGQDNVANYSRGDSSGNSRRPRAEDAW